MYYKISKNAIDTAELLKKVLQKHGLSFYIQSPTNQQFVILTMKQIGELQKQVSFDLWDKLDEEHQVVRFATSWATKEQDVDALLALLDK